MFEIIKKKRTKYVSNLIDLIIKKIDNTLLSIPGRKDSHEAFIQYIIYIYKHPNFTVEQVAECLYKSTRTIIRYRKLAHDHNLILHFELQYNYFNKPITDLEGKSTAIKIQVIKALQGYIRHRNTRYKFLQIKNKTAKKRKEKVEAAKNVTFSSCLSCNDKIFNHLKDFSTNIKIFESKKVKDLIVRTSLVRSLSKQFNVDRKITEKIAIDDCQRIEYEICDMGRKYRSNIAVLIDRIKKSLRKAKPILERGQTFFSRDERNLFRKTAVVGLSAVDKFLRAEMKWQETIRRQQEELTKKWKEMEENATLEHDFSGLMETLLSGKT